MSDPITPPMKNVLDCPPNAGLGWTRRSFVQSLGGMALAAGIVPALPLTEAVGEISNRGEKGADRARPRYRAVSWWLTFDDLTWPNPELMDKIRRRADQCAANGVNSCIIFGTHLRWDFMPLWGRLHDEFRFIADELHQRNIKLFDHHSATITHRPRNRDEALSIWQRNRHHVPFYPTLAEAATWQYEGSHLNDWRMMDVATGSSAYVPAYNAEQFCPNHPAFQQAYASYVKRLLADTGIDGLMSDDMIFYADWRACGCPHCRERFRREYGHKLPAVSDASFWGNRQSAAFRDWIAMRFQSTADFLGGVKQALPRDFPLLTCCSSSDNYYLPSFGMSYQSFIQNCNHVMLEMCGSTPTVQGSWDERIPAQLLHLDIARTHAAPCFGLGYGFFPDTAFFIWAVNKFLGSDCWFSTLKGRLNLNPAQLAALADDPEVVGEGYNWEKNHPDMFRGQPDTDIAIYFSRHTRDNYGQVPGDYSYDYNASCLELMRAKLACEVLAEIPVYGQTRRLLLSSVICLTEEQRRQLMQFMHAGGMVIATGPTGHYDGKGNRLATSWLKELGIMAELIEPSRPGGFPPYQNFPKPVQLASYQKHPAAVPLLPGGWNEVAFGWGRFCWRPERMATKATAAAVIARLQAAGATGVPLSGLPAEWQLRQYRDGNRLLIHALPGQVETILHPVLQNQFSKERIVEKLQFVPLSQLLKLVAPAPLAKVILHSPDLPESRNVQPGNAQTWCVDPAGIRRYFILECLS